MIISSPTDIKGFTLIELMVVVGIFAFMSTLVLANYPRFNAQIILENTAHEVALEVRQAQSFGLGVREALSEVDTYPGYGVYVPDIEDYDPMVYLYADIPLPGNDLGDGAYEGGACIPGSGECVEVLHLRNHGIATVCADLKTGNPGIDPFRTMDDVLPYVDSGYCGKDAADIIFTRPNPDATIHTYDDGGEDPSGHVNDVALIVSTPQGDVRTVVVWSTGQITVE